MAIDAKTLAASKKYTKETVEGAGAIKGKNCIIESITSITDGKRVTFKWYLNDDTVQTATMDVMNGDKGDAGAQGPQGPAGADGDDGLGIKSVDINEENHLIITYDDDTTHDAGEIPGGGSGEVISVNGKKGVVKLYGTDINLSDDPGATTIALSISQLQGSLANKVDKVEGKGLSENDYTDTDKTKLEALLGIKSAGSGLNFNSETGELIATGASIDIDTALDPTSINPVQNKAIAIPVQALQGSVLSLRTDKADKSELPTKLSELTNDDNYVQDASYTHTDNNYDATAKSAVDNLGTVASKNVPVSGDASNSEVVLGSDSRLTDARNAADVQDWAKAANKPTYTASEVGAVATTDVGSANGVAPLGSDQKVPAANLPSYVDDVLEYSTKSAFPVTGESGKIYVDLSDNKTYRWSGSTYVVVGNDLALGETSSTAYAGDKGKANADAIATIKDGASIDSFADVESALNGKADKVSGATNGHLAKLDSNGNLADSGKSLSDLQEKLTEGDGIDITNNVVSVEEMPSADMSEIVTPTPTPIVPYMGNPTGCIIQMMGVNAPDGYLKCDGQVYNIADYQNLADYFNAQFNSPNYFGGNGTTTFAVPDLRGEFLRGTGTKTGGKGSGASVGTHQEATELPYNALTVGGTASKGHWIRFDDSWKSGDYTNGMKNVDYHYGGTNKKVLNIPTTSSPADTSNDYVSIGIRPTNTSVLYCIKY